MNNLCNPRLMRANQEATTSTVTIAAGAAGYIDTDCSAPLGTDVNKIWLVQAICATSQLLGARKTGDTDDPKITNTFAVFLCSLDSAGHLEFYRNATTDVNYKINGCFR